MMSHESFQDMCSRIVTGHVELKNNNVDNFDHFPETWKTTTEALITSLKPKRDRFDKVCLSYIQKEFNNMNSVQKALDENTTSGEVPDEILCHVSSGIYDKAFNDLDDNEQAIIKVLACYIIISN